MKDCQVRNCLNFRVFNKSCFFTTPTLQELVRLLFTLKFFLRENDAKLGIDFLINEALLVNDRLEQVIRAYKHEDIC